MIRVQTVRFVEILQEYPHVDGVKMDIEGAEVVILEELTMIPSRLKWLVLEYSFDFFMDLSRFRSLVKHLELWFYVETTVEEALLSNHTTYQKRPYNGFIYCPRKKEDRIGFARYFAQEKLFIAIEQGLMKLLNTHIPRSKTWDGKKITGCLEWC